MFSGPQLQAQRPMALPVCTAASSAQWLPTAWWRQPPALGTVRWRRVRWSGLRTGQGRVQGRALPGPVLQRWLRLCQAGQLVLAVQAQQPQHCCRWLGQPASCARQQYSTTGGWEGGSAGSLRAVWRPVLPEAGRLRRCGLCQLDLHTRLHLHQAEQLVLAVPATAVGAKRLAPARRRQPAALGAVWRGGLLGPGLRTGAAIKLQGCGVPWAELHLRLCLQPP
jgi:hypothetical protein